MRISVNLATRPFVELRPLFLRLRIAMVLLALLAIGLGLGLHRVKLRAEAAQARMDRLKARTLAFQQQRQRDEARMRTPENRAVLDRSKFLNQLFAVKSFSWTSVMMDLERVVPAGIQVTSIEPVIAKNGDVSIRLKVSGDRDRAVQLVRNLEQSQRFLEPRLSGESAQALGTGKTLAAVDPLAKVGVEFDILSGYNPLPLTVRTATVRAAAASAKPDHAKPDNARPRDASSRDARPAVTR